MRICDSQFKQNKTANGNPYTYLAISVMQSWRGAHASNGFVLIRHIQIWKKRVRNSKLLALHIKNSTPKKRETTFWGRVKKTFYKLFFIDSNV